MKHLTYPWIKWGARLILIYGISCLALHLTHGKREWPYLVGCLHPLQVVMAKGQDLFFPFGGRSDPNATDVGFLCVDGLGSRKPYDDLTLIDTRPERMYEAPTGPVATGDTMRL
jgi:hypothetical protein